MFVVFASRIVRAELHGGAQGLDVFHFAFLVLSFGDPLFFKPKEEPSPAAVIDLAYRNSFCKGGL